MTRSVRWLLAAVPLAFLVAFFAYPVGTILGRGLWPDGTLDLSPLGDVLGDGSLRSVAWFTVWQAALSTALALLVGIPGAFVVARLTLNTRGDWADCLSCCFWFSRRRASC